MKIFCIFVLYAVRGTKVPFSIIFFEYCEASYIQLQGLLHFASVFKRKCFLLEILNLRYFETKRLPRAKNSKPHFEELLAFGFRKLFVFQNVQKLSEIPNKQEEALEQLWLATDVYEILIHLLIELKQSRIVRYLA